MATSSGFSVWTISPSVNTLVTAAGLTPSPTWMPVGERVSAEVGLPGTFMIW